MAIFVRDPQNNFVVLIGTTAVVAGDMLYSASGLWELADATNNTIFAEAIAIDDFASGEVGTVCTSCIIVDTTGPYTQGDTQYLSPTAGKITTTRPASSVTGELTQVVGFSVSPSEVHAEVKVPHEETIWVDYTHLQASGVSKVLSDWAGFTTPAVNDGCHGMGVFPSNTVGLVVAFSWVHNEDTLANGSFDLQVSSGFNDEAQAGTNDGTGNIAVGVLTAGDLVRDTVTTAFDAAGLVDAGAVFGCQIIKTVETADDDWNFLGLEVVVLVV